MREVVEQLITNKYDYEKGSLDFSCTKLEMEIRQGEVREGSFRIFSTEGKYTKGYISSTDPRMECLTTEFVGNEEEIQGERVNITLKATQPYSAEGIAMKDRIMAENGVLKTIHCGKRFADYLGIDATGDYGAFECNCGSENFDEMKNGALYVSVFSDFQMDSYTGQFGGEIRLAYLFEEKDGETVVKKFTGGSINGSIFDVQKTMVFSKERYKDDSYEGPFAVKLKNISIAGE